MTGTPVVLVPGLSGRTAEDFSFLLPMLRRHREVVAVDFSTVDFTDADFTEVDFSAAASIRELVDSVVTAVEGCSAPPTLVGYSLGAVVAAIVAAENPNALSSLALVAGWWQPAPKLVAFAHAWAQLRSDGSAALADVSALALISATGWASGRPLPADALTDRMIQLAATADLSALEPQITQPTLVVGGDHDELASTRQSRLLFGAIPDARYAELPTGHAVTHERPAELLHLLESFLDSPDRHPAGTLISAEMP